MAVLFFAGRRGIPCRVDEPYLVTFGNDFGNCSGSVGRSHSGGADRDHREGPRAATRAFVGRAGQVCISRAETRNLYRAGGSGWFRAFGADFGFAGIRAIATHACHCETAGERNRGWEWSSVCQYRPDLPATPRYWAGSGVSLRQFHLGLGRRDLPVSERDTGIP